MGNFFNNGPTILKLIIRVRTYHLEEKLLILKPDAQDLFSKDL